MKKIYRDFHRILLVAFALLCAGFAYGQRTITGTVTDDMGPLIQATVVIKGTSKGTVTDFDGNYSIEVPDDNTVLVFSYVGLGTQEKPVKGKTVIDVNLRVESKELKEAVVIGYGKQKREDLTGAITQMKGEDIADRPVLGVDQAMQGKAAGVQVTTSSGAPGAGVQVRIRGTSSINGADPLYVVDGIPVGTDISHLNPGDIESISVLKDASAAAIYGARGANGVILITLKSGAKKGGGDVCDVANVSFDAYYGIQSRWKEVDVMGADEYLGTLSKLGYNTSDLPSYSLTGAGTNWQDEIYREAAMQKYQVNLRGASENNTYSVSASFFDQKGIVKKTDYQRVTFSVKTSHVPFKSKKFRCGQSTGFNMGHQGKVAQGDFNSSVLAAALFSDPSIPLKDESLNNTQTEGWVPSSPFSGTNVRNPVRWLETDENVEKKMGLGGNVWAEYDILEDLKFKSTFGYSTWMPSESWYYRKYWTNASHSTQNTWMETTDQVGYNWTNNNTLTYSKEIKSKSDSTKTNHNFTILVGNEVFENTQSTTRLRGTGVFSEAEAQHYIPAFSEQEVDIKEWDKPASWAMASYLSRLTYVLKNKYMMTASLRFDGSSKVPDSTRWDRFPSFSLGWKIHEENFFKNNPMFKKVNEFKLRAGWGELGSESTLSEYPSFAYVYDAERRYSFGNGYADGISKGPAVTTSVAWERQRQWNVGADLAFLENKVLLTVDYFNKQTIDMIVKVPLNTHMGGEVPGNPAYSTIPNVPENAGTMSNSGLEMYLSYRKQEGDFHYNIGGTFTRVISNVDDLGMGTAQPGGKLANPIGFDVSMTQEGSPYACFYGYIVDESNPVSASGQFRFIDVNGDNVVDDADRVIMGSPHPDFTYGLTLNGDYKGIDFGLSFQGSYGNQIFNATKYYLHGSNPENFSTDVEFYEVTGEDGSVAYSTGSWGAPHNYFLEDGSYLRLKDVSLGYSLPKNISKKIGVKRLRVYVQSQNLVTFTSYSGADPELSISKALDDQGSLELGIDRGNYPQARTFIFGVNLGL